MHELERALVFEEGPELDLESLLGAGAGATHFPAVPGPGSLPGDTVTSDWWNAGFRFPESGFSLEDAILRLIREALAQSDGNVSAAARRLGVSRDYLRYRLGPAK